MMFFKIEDYAAMKAALASMCAEFVRDCVPESAVFDCKLVANELLSNALRYGGGSARFCVERNGNEIRIAVKSACDYVPPEKSACSGIDAERGRGLFLVDSIGASRLYNTEEGICVIVKIAEQLK